MQKNGYTSPLEHLEKQTALKCLDKNMNTEAHNMF